VIDSDWSEILLDHSTAAKRAALTTVVAGWTDQCARKGFQGLEPDNLDAYTRSKGLLTEAQGVAYAGSLATYTHSKAPPAVGRRDGPGRDSGTGPGPSNPSCGCWPATGCGG
jgi:hypothetical protein